MKILLILLCSIYQLSAAWVMFNDGEDTYIYNNANGDIYIRYKKGGKNYEDSFIKMPAGVILDNKEQNNKKTSDSTDSTNSMDKKELNSYNSANSAQQAESLKKKFQDLQNNMLDKALE